MSWMRSTRPGIGGSGFKHRTAAKPEYTGEQYVTCDICQCKRRASETRLQWNGFVACEDDYFPKPWFLEPLPLFPNEGGNTLQNPRPKPAVTYINPGPNPFIPPYLGIS
jgi:hypothetical protein